MAQLQGVEVGTVHRSRTLADARLRGEAGDAEAAAKYGPVRPGDMPAADGKLCNSPYWTMGTFRKWKANRPGQGAGAGRPVGSGKGRAVKVKLPFECPHCHHEITKDDLPQQGDGQKGGKAA
jgi:hypothetical protein